MRSKRNMRWAALRYSVSAWSMAVSRDSLGFVISDSTNSNVIDGKAYGFFDVQNMAWLIS